MTPVYFSSQKKFDAWLRKNHSTAAEILVGYHKKGSGTPGITWPESVEAALCFGWIDGVRRTVDDKRYVIRFTPRKPGSIWSAVNIKKVEELKKSGAMQPAGLEVFEQRDRKKTGIYSFEKKSVRLSGAFLKKFKRNTKAWSYFESMPPSYRKPAINWVMSARQEPTRLRRIETLITDSAAGRKIKPLSYR